MKKMSRRIFVNMFFISILVILLSTFLTAGIVYRSYAKQNIESIRNELSAAANGVNLNGAAYLKSLKSEHRVTLIGRDGTVLYDNQNNTREMENRRGIFGKIFQYDITKGCQYSSIIRQWKCT